MLMNMSNARALNFDALDKHQIQASALDLSYFTWKSKCKFIDLIHRIRII